MVHHGTGRELRLNLCWPDIVMNWVKTENSYYGYLVFSKFHSTTWSILKKHKMKTNLSSLHLLNSLLINGTFKNLSWSLYNWISNYSYQVNINSVSVQDLLLAPLWKIIKKDQKLGEKILQEILIEFVGPVLGTWVQH